ncbi:hypothetical protein SNE40_008755 [Patella caerulea]|uniref:Fibronectin type-III domain-containing protein n=1 Tax=Patella caerulea TaxID=87958 RepID=A0AAN8PWQ3_PATCE
MLRNYCLVLLFILLHGADANPLCAFFPENCSGIGELKPDNPFVYIGDELVLNCSLNGPLNGSYNASDLRFSHHNDIYVPKKYVHLLSEDLAQLRLPITSPNDKSHYMCSLKNDAVGNQDLSLEYRPRPVENVSCVVANWENMTCNWQLGPYVKVKEIGISIYWWVQSGNGYYNCDRSSQTLCFFNADSYNEGNTYTMMINVSHTPSNGETEIASKNYTIYADQIVKPDPVTDLTAYQVNSTCSRLTWSHSRSEKDLKYRLEYYSHWDKEETVIVLDPGKSLEQTVCGLHPDTSYNFSVAAHPRTEGFWSETVHTSTTTLEDVPSFGPATTNGSYFEYPCDGIRKINIFFKHVAKENANGVITAYGAAVRSSSTGVENFFSAADSNKISVYLRCDVGYYVDLYARTKIGKSKNNTQFFIPATKTVTTDVKLHIVISNDTGTGNQVKAVWRNTSPSLKPAYLYWCRSSITDICQGDLNWLPVEDDVTDMVLPVSVNKTEAKEYIFAISFMVGDSPSSMTFSECIYRKYSVPADPPVGFQLDKENPDLSLGLSWSPKQCDQQSLIHIDNYMVHYCPADRQDGCLKPQQTVKVASSHSRYQLNDLKADINYSVWLQAESSGELGPESVHLHAVPTDSRLSTGAIVGISLALFVVVVVAGVGVYFTVVRRCKKLIEPYKITDVLDVKDVYISHKEHNFISSADDFTPKNSNNNILSTGSQNEDVEKAEKNLNNEKMNIPGSAGSSKSDATTEMHYNKITFQSSGETDDDTKNDIVVGQVAIDQTQSPVVTLENEITLIDKTISTQNGRLKSGYYTPEEVEMKPGPFSPAPDATSRSDLDYNKVAMKNSGDNDDSIDNQASGGQKLSTNCENHGQEKPITPSFKKSSDGYFRQEEVQKKMETPVPDNGSPSANINQNFMTSPDEEKQEEVQKKMENPVPDNGSPSANINQNFMTSPDEEKRLRSDSSDDSIESGYKKVTLANGANLNDNTLDEVNDVEIAQTVLDDINNNVLRNDHTPNLMNGSPFRITNNDDYVTQQNLSQMTNSVPGTHNPNENHNQNHTISNNSEYVTSTELAKKQNQGLPKKSLNNMDYVTVDTFNN